jgi:CheY-like chemotaxis protein
MTNEAISAILDHLCNEARNSVHATFGVIELLRDAVTEPNLRDSVVIGSASADQLLRSIDDFRELVSDPHPPGAVEDFDLGQCVGHIIEVLNMTSGSPLRRMVLDAPVEPLRITQDRNSVEQAITRVLSTALSLSESAEVNVSLHRGRREDRVRMAVASRDAELAGRLNKWLNANVKQADLADPLDIPFGVCVMVAAKRLHALGGMAQLAEDSAGRLAVALDLPSQKFGGDGRDASLKRAAPVNALSILVAEDHDESFALSELMLQDEHVRRACDGQEAIGMLQRQRFDVVFMDIHMPGMDGYTAIRRMRDWETETGSARTPIVVLSSDDLERQRRSAAECGCSGFLRKPLRRADMVNLLDHLKQGRLAVA